MSKPRKQQFAILLCNDEGTVIGPCLFSTLEQAKAAIQSAYNETGNAEKLIWKEEISFVDDEPFWSTSFPGLDIDYSIFAVE